LLNASSRSARIERPARRRWPLLNRIFTQKLHNTRRLNTKAGSAALFILGAGGIILGSAFAASAGKFPASRLKLEQYGGGLFIVGVAFLGLAFLGLAFPMI
jgi:hypothetical protein